MITKRIVLIFLTLTYSLIGMGQDVTFHPPVDIPIYLAGNFGELRSNHFHTGLDIKTQGREGLNVFAAEEGFVSRIKVSPWGYGNALYLEHPNGYTTVYGHLQAYSPKIEEFLRMAQYNQESFAVDLVPGKGQIPVKRGEIVGLSGNSGSSGGPHVHFEVRETDTEFPVNPMLFGFDVQDDIPPVIEGFLFEPLNDSSYVNGKNDLIEKKASSSAEHLISVWGEVGLAISTFDRLNGQSNKCGTFEIILEVDDEQVYAHKLDKLDFETNRHMNAHIDYAQYRQGKKRYQRCFILPGNKLQIYQEGTSFLTFRRPGVSEVKCTLRDVSGNENTFRFKVKVEKPTNSKPKVEEDCTLCKQFRFDTVNAFRASSCTVFIPQGRLYEDYFFVYEEAARPEKAYSSLHKVGSSTEPLQNKYTLKIEVEDYEGDPRKLVVANQRSGGRWTSLGGRYNNGWMEVKPKEFGRFAIKADSIPPVVQNLDLRKDMTYRKEFSFKITDDLSGIDKYRGEIDGQWVLMEYHPRRNRLTCTFDESRLDRGKHTFKLVVADERRNEKEFTMDFEW